MASFNPDHALAILLQARFNEEDKKLRAKDKENKQDPPPNMSVIDPEWETTDPCPDIHALFLVFNQRFFWNRLLSIEVKWSSQMTSCAGVCVYQGRNGLCSVRLSAPLLKLRPRSDLVETLLHEMIHAYLFVTKNDRDRDGHGPEFHKHMYRINREAGTNITVYHSFHAEVKVYQQHWWRCNGPCQYRAPFFGMVKRAKNREPGPNDFWWVGHQAACGGKFIKVREPEGYKSKKKGKEEGKSKDRKDLRTFFKKPSDLKRQATPTASQMVGSNVFGVNDLVLKATTNKQSHVSSNGGLASSEGSLGAIRTGNTLNSGYTLGVETSKKTTSETVSSGKGIRRGGVVANRGGGTVVVTGHQGKNKPSSPNTILRIDTFTTFSGPGFKLGGSHGTVDKSKSRLLSIAQEPQQKKPKVEEQKQSQIIVGTDENSSIREQNVDLCYCLVCNKRIIREEMDVHLEGCTGLQNVFNNSSIADDDDGKEISAINKKYQVTSCPVCSLHIDGNLNTHLDECLESSGILNVSDEPIIEISDSESPVTVCDNRVPNPIVLLHNNVEIMESERRVVCPICGLRFGESRINSHVNQCLDS